MGAVKHSKYSLDANILVYAVDNAAQEKHGSAVNLLTSLAEQSTILTLQSLGEFYHVVTRKNRLPLDVATEIIEEWTTLFPVVSAQPQTLARAIRANKQHQMPFWDAMLWATVKEAGVTTLFSEDFQHGQVMDGVRFCNPFLEQNPLG
jgi:predicted nucleic acid-binding protein